MPPAKGVRAAPAPLALRGVGAGLTCRPREKNPRATLVESKEKEEEKESWCEQGSALWAVQARASRLPRRAWRKLFRSVDGDLAPKKCERLRAGGRGRNHNQQKYGVITWAP